VCRKPFFYQLLSLDLSWISLPNRSVFVSNLGIHREFAIVTGILVDPSRWLGSIASLDSWMTGVLPIGSANMQPNRRSAA
jgi:hypothetical protein